jgi:hypothetical protein
VLASVDFTTIEVWTKSGLVTCYLLFVMELATRRVHFGGCTPNPDESWMCQAARNLNDAEDGFLLGKKYLLRDRDAKFSEAFRVIVEQGGIEAVRLPPRSPNLNPNLERFMRSVKEECLECTIFFGERSLQTAVADFLVHYHQERNHQGLDNRLIEPGEEVGRAAGEIACRERLGGMLRYYYRKAALPWSAPHAGRSAAPPHEVCAGDHSRPCHQAEKGTLCPAAAGNRGSAPSLSSEIAALSQLQASKRGAVAGRPSFLTLRDQLHSGCRGAAERVACIDTRGGAR